MPRGSRITIKNLIKSIAAVTEFLLAIGEDQRQKGLLVPQTVSRCCVELFGGMQEDPAAHLRKRFIEGNKEMVIVTTFPFST